MSSDYLRSVPIRRLPLPAEENPIWNILGSAVSSVIAVALSLPFLLAFLLVLPACLSIRWLLLFIYYNRHGTRSGSGPESVRCNDSRWLGTEWQSSVIHAVLVFEGKEGVNVDHFRRVLISRVIPLYPRLTQTLISLPITAGGRNCWLTDAKFSIEHHVFSGPSFLKDEKDLQDYISKLVKEGLPENKPPWELHVFQSFGDNQDTIVVLRIHQSVADGTALMRLLCHSLADSQVIEIPARPRFGTLAFCMNVFRACIVGPLTVLFWLFLSGEDCNLLTHRSTWTGSVTVTWSASITLPKVIRIKQVTRSTFNCVLLSALAGAIRRLLQGCGVKQPPDVKVVVPMDIRNQSSTSSPGTRLGNKTSSMIISLPVAVEGCIPRLWATRKTLNSLKTSADPVILYVATAALMSVGSASFARHLVNFLTDKASMQFSSLPGPTSEILLEGQTLKGIYPVLPAQANLGISITTITYANQVFVSVIAERALGPAAELILEYLEDQIEILWKLLLNRRVPGEPESPTLFTRSRISESPIKEITSRLSLVQKEVERLSEGKDSDRDVKLSTLRAEFCELMDELKRRQSLNDVEISDSLRRTRRRAFSCSTSLNQTNHSSEPPPEEVALSNIFISHDLKESNKINANSRQQSQNVNLPFEDAHLNITTKFQNNKNDVDSPKNTCDSQKTLTNCFINISRDNYSSIPLKNSSGYLSIKNNNSYQNNDKENFQIKEDCLFAQINSEVTSEGLQCTPPKSECNIQNLKHLYLGSESSAGAKSSSKDRATQVSQESKIAIEKQTTVPETIIKLPDLSEESWSNQMGPINFNCYLCYKTYLEAVKLGINQNIQVHCQHHKIRMPDTIDDSDESEISGGVLI